MARWWYLHCSQYASVITIKPLTLRVHKPQTVYMKTIVKAWFGRADWACQHSQPKQRRHQSWNVINWSPLLTVISNHEISSSRWDLSSSVIMKDHEFMIFQNMAISLALYELIKLIKTVFFSVKINQFRRTQTFWFYNGHFWN